MHTLKSTHTQTYTIIIGHMHSASCVPLPALIRLMITEGQSACDPCPNIKQINTTLITKMWTHLQSPLIKENCFDRLRFHFPSFVLFPRL